MRPSRHPTPPLRALAAHALALALALGLAACGATVSTSNFKGAEKEVATTVSNLQADATANEPAKICSRDFAQSVERSLGGAKGCEESVKTQLRQVDSLEVSIQHIAVGTGGLTATASTKSVYKGKTQPYTMTLRKEGGAWRIVTWKLAG